MSHTQFIPRKRPYGEDSPGEDSPSDDTPDERPDQKSSGENSPAPKRTFNFEPFVPSSESSIPTLREDLIDEPEKPNISARPSAFSTSTAKKGMSFAERMFAKMGYKQGEGLGADSQGRSRIIEAQLRPQGAGLGAVREKSKSEREYEKQKAKEEGRELGEDSDSEEERRKRRQKRKQKKVKIDEWGEQDEGEAEDAAREGDGRRAKTRYMTAEDLKAQAPRLHIPEIFAPILDMTGPEIKLLTSTAGIFASDFVKATDTAQPHELSSARKVIADAQDTIFKAAEDHRRLEERRKWRELQIAQELKLVEELRKEFQGLQLALSQIGDELQTAVGWAQTVECLKRLLEIEGVKDEKEVTGVVVAALHPFLRQAGWDPLLEPTRFVDDLALFAPILLKVPSSATALDRRDPDALFAHNFSQYDEDVISRSHRSATTAYESMLYALWLPSVIAAIRQWDPSSDDTAGATAVLTLYEAWEKMLPEFLKVQVIEAVVRRLETAVDDWHPRKKLRHANTNGAGKKHDLSLPHFWIFPWLPHLPPEHLHPSSGLVSNVRRKFRSILHVWDFAQGVVPGLSTWRATFGAEHWSKLSTSTLHAIGHVLRSKFTVDPSDQKIEVLMGVQEWSDVVGVESVGAAIVQEMFPKWHKVLKEWLDMGDEADLEEVAAWFEWWTDGDVLGADVRALQDVRNEFDKANRKLWGVLSDEALQAHC